MLYRRLTLDDLRENKTLPYLLGGNQQPSCTNCRREDTDRGRVCRLPGTGCAVPAGRLITQRWLERGFELGLTFTPCDLWPYIRGRTLLFLGDSMVQGRGGLDGAG